MILEIMQWITIAMLGIITLINAKTLGYVDSEKFLVKIVKRLKELQVK